MIRVTGKGVIKVKPDMTRTTMTLEGCYVDYEQALHMSSEDTECLKDILEKQGFERSDVKTLSFNVDTKNERYQAKDKSWKDRLVGYEYRQAYRSKRYRAFITRGEKLILIIVRCAAIC
jgi:hypothetical protein